VADLTGVALQDFQIANKVWARIGGWPPGGSFLAKEDAAAARARTLFNRCQ